MNAHSSCSTKSAKAVGLGLMLSPFIAMTYIMVNTVGWLDALLIWGATVVMTACLRIGVHLFYDKNEEYEES